MRLHVCYRQSIIIIKKEGGIVLLKKKREDKGQLKLDFNQQEQRLKTENNAMLVDISFPLHAYIPGSICPECGKIVHPGCPILCSNRK